MPAKQDKTIEEITKLTESVVSNLGLLIVGINIAQQGKRRVVNVTIHRKGERITLDDCEKVSRQLEQLLDERAESAEGPVIEGAYALEVESPGIDRILKKESEYRIFCGETVELRLKESIQGLPLVLKGRLLEFENSCFRIENPKSLEKPKTKGKAATAKDDCEAAAEVSIPLTALYSVRLYPETQLAQSDEEQGSALEPNQL
ncbi:MAG: hypothetical protein K2X93_11100 [Candidatus Obscuribacterales bacterium]|nr:hypothetical protein [Candidatus Obscuribacterales bacterium]